MTNQVGFSMLPAVIYESSWISEDISNWELVSSLTVSDDFLCCYCAKYQTYQYRHSFSSLLPFPGLVDALKRKKNQLKEMNLIESVEVIKLSPKNHVDVYHTWATWLHVSTVVIGRVS
ncbi:hypothetical protein YC2023_031930 [Brassica napus]